MSREKSLKIVLVDDDPMVLHALKAFFQRNGHVVTIFEDPSLCPIFTRPHGACFQGSACPDIIITDFDMPDVSGVKFVDFVYSKGCKCKHVALLSGIGVPDREMRRLAKYGTRFFTKPLDFAEVEAWMAATESPYD